MRKIALFTCFHPEGGGGAAILRSQVDALVDAEVTWYYLGVRSTNRMRCISLGANTIGGPILADLAESLRLWTGNFSASLTEIARRIAETKSDCHWVVAMNEGVGLGVLLKEMTPRTPLHVSVQDDQAGWMWARSRRYKLFAWMARWQWERLLHEADSIDVVSEGMAHYYQEKFGVRSRISHVYVRQLPSIGENVLSKGAIRIGHIGSLYDKGDFSCFLRAMRSWSKRKSLKLELTIIGYTGPTDWLKSVSEADMCCVIPSLPEDMAVRHLSACDFVYAMYPFSWAFRTFRKTSLPTKLSTYIQAQRPIFAHTPKDSTLAKVVEMYEIGAVAASTKRTELESTAEGLIARNIRGDSFENTREALFGWRNIDAIADCLKLNRRKKL
jgi:hypothetical protein